MNDTPAKSTSPLLAYARLFRVPNVFTAMADIGMGFLFASGAPAAWEPLVLLLAASSLLYTAGMVLNDVYDYEVDRVERPGRPLPSGQISRTTANFLGYGMLAAGFALGVAAGVVPETAALPWRAGLIAALLAACIVAYDAWAKRTPLGPVAMGGCRFLNVLLGMSTASSVASDGANFLGYHGAQLLVASGIGLYIVGVTWFARTEARKRSSSQQLLGATAVMIAGIGILAMYPQSPTAPPLQLAGVARAGALGGDSMWLLLLVLIAFPIVARCLMAATNPTPRYVQAAVKRAILSLILFDAAVTLAVAGPIGAFAILALLAPTLLLGAWVYST